METTMLPFVPGTHPPGLIPLGRYLPLLPEGMVSSWFDGNIPKGEWILDPIGSSPATALELARNGWRALVTCNNPIIAFMLRIMARAPQPGDFQSALAELSRIRHGDERLDSHLQSLYLTECNSCGQVVPVQYYLWRKDEKQPYARVFECRHCGEAGEHPLRLYDMERMNQIGNNRLHRAWAAERINARDEHGRKIVDEALSLYLPRSLYFIFTMLTSLEGIPMPEYQRNLLLALVLSTLDAGSNMWHATGGRSRPRQLSSPQVFRENNLWMVLEESVQEWCSSSKPVELTVYPTLPEGETGICLFQGRFRKLENFDQVIPGKIEASACVFPHPKQAFWTLSAVWSGWLWGPEAVHHLQIGLERRRYDWYWYAPAIASTMEALHTQIPGVQLTGFLSEVDGGFLAAVVTAGAFSGLNFKGIALREDDGIAQVSWAGTPPHSIQPPMDLGKQLIGAFQTYLEESAQPASHLRLVSVGLAATVAGLSAQNNPSETPERILKKVFVSLAAAFCDRTILKRYRSGQEDETGMWWLAAIHLILEMPLYDRIEKAFMEYLQHNQGCRFEEIDRALCKQFPGWQTPETGFIQVLLESYGEEAVLGVGRWSYHPRELPAERRADLETARQSLQNIGNALGYKSAGDNPLVWKNQDGSAAMEYYLLDSSIISGWVYTSTRMPPSKCILVLPGSRSRLLAWKLKNDPRLDEAVSAGWRFLKLRHLRHLAGIEKLTLGLWEDWIDEDPPVWEDAKQISLFN